MSEEDERKDEAAESAGEGESEPVAENEEASDPGEELTVEDILAQAPDDGQAADDTTAVLQATLEERTRDLQRLSAEFQNYRKRVERDKARASEQATGAVMAALLPVLDDLDRAREHGDLHGPFGSVAEQLIGTLTKQGLESFGEKGDPFDPQIHEAVAHMQSADVDGPTCIDVMRRGYRLGDRLLRAAMVAVADPLDEPEPEPAEPADEDTESDEGTEESADAESGAAGEEDAGDSAASEVAAESSDSEDEADSKDGKDS